MFLNLVSFGYSERIYELCWSEFFYVVPWAMTKMNNSIFSNEYFFIQHAMCQNTRTCTQMQYLPISNP